MWSFKNQEKFKNTGQAKEGIYLFIIQQVSLPDLSDGKRCARHCREVSEWKGVLCSPRSSSAIVWYNGSERSVGAATDDCKHCGENHRLPALVEARRASLKSFKGVRQSKGVGGSGKNTPRGNSMPKGPGAVRQSETKEEKGGQCGGRGQTTRLKRTRVRTYKAILVMRASLEFSLHIMRKQRRVQTGEYHHQI